MKGGRDPGGRRDAWLYRQDLGVRWQRNSHSWRGGKERRIWFGKREEDETEEQNRLSGVFGLRELRPHQCAPTTLNAKGAIGITSGRPGNSLVYRLSTTAGAVVDTSHDVDLGIEVN